MYSDEVTWTVEFTGKTDYQRKHFTTKESIFDGYLGAKYRAIEDFEARIALGPDLFAPVGTGMIPQVYGLHQGLRQTQLRLRRADR